MVLGRYNDRYVINYKNGLYNVYDKVDGEVIVRDIDINPVCKLESLVYMLNEKERELNESKDLNIRLNNKIGNIEKGICNAVPYLINHKVME